LGASVGAGSGDSLGQRHAENGGRRDADRAPEVVGRHHHQRATQFRLAYVSGKSATSSTGLKPIAASSFAGLFLPDD
jgi:hypothetical protein